MHLHYFFYLPEKIDKKVRERRMWFSSHCLLPSLSAFHCFALDGLDQVSTNQNLTLNFIICTETKSFTLRCLTGDGLMMLQTVFMMLKGLIEVIRCRQVDYMDIIFSHTVTAFSSLCTPCVVFRSPSKFYVKSSVVWITKRIW